jgi:transcriptional regulator with XRE-family HTH domain
VGRSHSDVVKRQVLDAVLNLRRPQTEVSHEYNVPKSTVNRWVADAKAGSEVDADQRTRKRLEEQQTNPPSELRLGSRLAGRVVYSLRGRAHAKGSRAPNADQFGRLLGVPGSTLRNLEAGGKLPETSLAYALAKVCGLSLSTTFFFLAVARCHDECADYESADELGTAVRREDSRFGFVLDSLMTARTLRDPDTLKEHFDKVPFQDRVYQLLRTGPGVAATRAKTPSIDAFTRVSPVLLDTLYALSERLRLFHPALDESALAEWEHGNCQRIRRVIAYYSEPRALLETIDSFKCEFLDFSDAPVKYVIILKGASRQQADEARESIVRKATRLPRASVIVKEVSASNPAIGALERALRFDSATSRLCTEDAGSSAVKMRTLNLYELRLAESELSDSGNLFCAFVDNKRPLRREASKTLKAREMHFTRALQSVDVDRVRDLLSAVLSDEGVDL